MNRYEIQKELSLCWEGTQDNQNFKYAIETARQPGHIDTVEMRWRWLTFELCDLYHFAPDEAAACYSYCEGWVDGMTTALNKALLAAIN